MIFIVYYSIENENATNFFFQSFLLCIYSLCFFFSLFESLARFNFCVTDERETNLYVLCMWKLQYVMLRL